MQITICLLLGVVSSQFISSLYFIILISVLGLALAIYIIRYCDPALYAGEATQKWFIYILIAFLVCGYLLGKIAMRQPPVLTKFITASTQGPIICEAKVLTNPIKKSRSWQMDLKLFSCQKNPKAEPESVFAKVRFYSWELLETFSKGDLIKFQGRLKNPRQYKNPGSFNYPLYLKSQGIKALATPTRAQWIVKIKPASGWFSWNWLNYMRMKIEKTILNNTDTNSAALLNAISIGQKKYLKPELRQVFSRTGVAHLLAISGLHVGFIVLLVFWLTRITLGWWPGLLNWQPLPYLASLLSLPAIWIYVSLADFPISAVRAAIMITAFILAFVSWRYKHDLLTALATAVFFILIVSPPAVFSLSFQFSVIAVFGIIVFLPIIWSKFDRFFPEPISWPKQILKRLLQLLTVTLIATLVTAPLSGYYFQQATSLGLISNIIAIPLLGLVILPLAMLSSAFTFIYAPIGAWGWQLAGSICAGLLNFLKFLDANLGFMVWSWAPNKWEVILAFACLSAVIIYRYLPYRKIILSVLSFLVILDFSFWYILPHMQHNLKINFIDVGQGDCILVQFPNQKNMLIDGGGVRGSEFDVGAKVVIPALISLGVRELDYLLLTHPHHDHYSGLGSVAQKMKPKILFHNGLGAPEDEQAEWQEFLTKVGESQVELKIIEGNSDFHPALKLKEGNSQILVFAPRPQDLRGLDLNDTSLVAKLNIGQQSILLTGDLEAAGEQILAEKNLNLQSQVLKLAHHGSETSTSLEFLEAVNPKTAIITVGQENKYGFPDKIVLDRLAEKRIKVYRTDKQGMITIKTDGNNLKIATYK